MPNRSVTCFAIVVLPVNGGPFVKMMCRHERRGRAGSGTSGCAVSIAVVMAELPRRRRAADLIATRDRFGHIRGAGASATIQYRCARVHQDAEGMTAARRNGDAWLGPVTRLPATGMRLRMACRKTRLGGPCQLRVIRKRPMACTIDAPLEELAMTPRITDEPGLHLCMRPLGYVTPRAFFKLFYEAALFSRSRSSAIDYCVYLLRSTRTICGRCGTIFDITIWSRTEIQWLYALARRSDGREHRERMQRDCDEKRLVCPGCGLTTHLAQIRLPLFEDIAIASPAPDPADDVQAARD